MPELATPAFGLIYALVLSALANFALLALVFGPLEYLLPARRQAFLRGEWGTDLSFFLGQYLVFGVAAGALLNFVRQYLEAHSFLAVDPAAPPTLTTCVLAVIAGDVLVYWFHRASHQCSWLWRFHRVHHSATTLDWLAAHREHPLDGLLTQLCQNAPALLLGVRVEYLAGLVLFRNAWAIFIHSNVQMDLGPLRWVFGAPELHRHHHAQVIATQHNFANLAPWLDLIFGTYHRPSARDELPLGVFETHATGYVAQLLEPLGLTRRDALPPQAEAAPPAP